MGNICCGPEEDYKHGAWYSDDDERDVENGGGAFGDDDDAEYNAKATDREQLILLHEQQKKSGIVKEAKTKGKTNWKLVKARVRRASITSTPMEVTPSFAFKPPSFPKPDDTVKFLLDALADNFVFDSIEEEVKLQFVDAMQRQDFKQGDWIMHQGDVGDYFYIVEEGEVAFHVVGEDSAASSKDSNPDNFPPQVGTGSNGSTFGELALLYNTSRAASVRVLTPLKLYKIDQLTFRSLLMSRQVTDRSNVIAVLQKLSIFQDLCGSKIRKLVDAFTIMDYSPGERIVNKGDKGSIFYIVKSGQVKVDDIGHGASKFKEQTLEEGDCFGERALITGETRAANVSAITKASLLAISKDVLEEILGPLNVAIRESSNASYLRSIPLFQDLTADEINRCVTHLKEESFKKGSKIVAKGKLYLIQEGHALMMVSEKGNGSKESNKNGGSDPKKESNGTTLVKLDKGDYFGDIWNCTEENDPPQSPASDTKDEDTINAEVDMKCLTLLSVDIQLVIGNLERVPGCPKANQSAGPNARIKYLKSRSSSLELLKTKKSSANRDVLNLSKLKKHRILGMGTFGKVWLVTPKSNTKDKPTPYALKMVSKRQVLEQQLASAVMREKNVMETIVHPLLVHMASSFQDKNYLYFVMDLILGGELFEIIYPEGPAKVGSGEGAWKDSTFYKSFGSEDDTKALKKLGLAGVGLRETVFYSACVIEAFAHLHNRRIAYRDLKPENVMLNEKGYCVVVDMGFAKVVLDKTYTMCGTPEYLAPEIIANIGHNHAADYWSFACLLYELVVGQTPFFAAHLDQLSLLKKIVKANYEFPASIVKLRSSSSSTLIDKVLCQWKDLVSRLLKNKNAERLGNLRNGIEDILNHDMFENIDFNELRQQNLPAPWVPNIVDPMDMANFTNNFRSEEKQTEYFVTKIPERDQQSFVGF